MSPHCPQINAGLLKGLFTFLCSSDLSQCLNELVAFINKKRFKGTVMEAHLPCPTSVVVTEPRDCTFVSLGDMFFVPQFLAF